MSDSYWQTAMEYLNFLTHIRILFFLDSPIMFPLLQKAPRRKDFRLLQRNSEFYDKTSNMECIPQQRVIQIRMRLNRQSLVGKLQVCKTWVKHEELLKVVNVCFYVLWSWNLEIHSEQSIFGSPHTSLNDMFISIMKGKTERRVFKVNYFFSQVSGKYENKTLESCWEWNDYIPPLSKIISGNLSLLMQTGSLQLELTEQDTVPLLPLREVSNERRATHFEEAF